MAAKLIAASVTALLLVACVIVLTNNVSTDSDEASSARATVLVASDSDSCLSAKADWKGWSCNRAKKYCTNDKWRADVSSCCPSTCADDCMSSKDDWSGYTCNRAEQYCSSAKYRGVIETCCPGTCGAPPPPPPPPGPIECNDEQGGKDEFGTALFLYWSPVDKDLLTVTCSAAKALGISNNYQREQASAIGFISESKTELANTALYLHYSSSRKDYVASTDKPETNNGYVQLATLGYIMWNYPMGTYDISELNKFWSGSNSDIGVVPFASNRDLNYLTDGGFRKRGSVLGYMHVGTCDLCNIVMSPSYGAKGGPGCPDTCPRGTNWGTAVYNFKGGAFDAMAEKQGEAMDIINSYGYQGSKAQPHMTFAYYCCLTPSEFCQIKQVYQEFDWATNPVKIEYERAFANVDKSGRASIVADVDEATQDRLLALWAKVEAKITEKNQGISARAGYTNRDKQYLYHNTLKQLAYTDYPIDYAVADINKKIPVWTKPITVNEKPETRFC